MFLPLTGQCLSQGIQVEITVEGNEIVAWEQLQSGFQLIGRKWVAALFFADGCIQNECAVLIIV